MPPKKKKSFRRKVEPEPPPQSDQEEENAPPEPPHNPVEEGVPFPLPEGPVESAGSPPAAPGPSGMHASEHDNPTIHPYVLQDLQRARSLDVWDWLEIALGVTPAKIDKWATLIGRAEWFKDSIIEDSMAQYCSSRQERERYKPFVDIANRILDLAHETIPEVKRGGYPINNIRYAVHDRKVTPNEQHGELAADRRPDIVVVRADKAEVLMSRTGRIQWTDILYFLEMKYSKNLSKMLDEERKKHGMPPSKKADDVPDLMESDDEEDTERPANVRRKPSRTTQKGRTGTRRRMTRAVAPKTGQKRKRGVDDDDTAARKRRIDGREHDDPVANLDPEKPDQWDPTKDIAIPGLAAACQATAYGMETTAGANGTRVYCIALILKDERMTMWYYSPTGLLYTSQYLSLVEDFGVVAAIIVALALATPEQLGALPTRLVKPPTASLSNYPYRNLSGFTLHVKHPSTRKTVLVTLRDSVFTQYSLTGRRTFVYQADMDLGLGRGLERLIIKFAYQAERREPEHKLLEHAHKAGVRHLPDAHLWSDLHVFEDVARPKYRLECRTAKRKKTAAPPEPDCEDRILRVIVYTEYYPIRTLFAKHPELIPVMVDQIMECIHDLRYKAHMLHRDLSVNNIMWVVQDGVLDFKLIDFDMAKRVANDDGSPLVSSASSTGRSGTLAFMAYDLVYNIWKYSSKNPSLKEDWKPLPHYVRHDYMSLFYVALWCASALPVKGLSVEDLNGRMEEVKCLEKGGLRSIGASKKVLCITPIEDCSIALPPKSKCLTDWFYNWVDVLGPCVRELDSQGLKRRRGIVVQDFDEDTANGTLTRDTIKAALDTAIPAQDWTIQQLLAECAPESSRSSAAADSPPADAPPTDAPPAEEQQRQSSRARPQRKAAGARVIATKVQETASVAADSIRSRLRPRKAKS